MVDAARAQAILGDLKAHALAAEDVLIRHEDILEVDLRVAFAVVVAEHRQVAHDSHARRVRGHGEHGLLAVNLRVRAGLAHHDHHLQVRVHAVGGEPLAAVEHVAAVGAFHTHAHVGGIAGSHARLRHGKRGADFAVEQGFQVLFPVLVGAVEFEDLHVSGVRCVAVAGLGGEVHGPAHDLRQGRVFGIGQARAVAVGTCAVRATSASSSEVGVEEVPQAALLRLGLQLVEDGGEVVRVAGFAHLLLVHGFGRVDALVHEFGELALVLQGPFAVLEVHCFTFRRQIVRQRAYP